MFKDVLSIHETALGFKKLKVEDNKSLKSQKINKLVD